MNLFSNYTWTTVILYCKQHIDFRNWHAASFYNQFLGFIKMGNLKGMNLFFFFFALLLFFREKEFILAFWSFTCSHRYGEFIIFLYCFGLDLSDLTLLLICLSKALHHFMERFKLSIFFDTMSMEWCCGQKVMHSTK